MLELGVRGRVGVRVRVGVMVRVVGVRVRVIIRQCVERAVLGADSHAAPHV